VRKLPGYDCGTPPINALAPWDRLPHWLRSRFTAEVQAGGARKCCCRRTLNFSRSSGHRSEANRIGASKKSHDHRTGDDASSPSPTPLKTNAQGQSVSRIPAAAVLSSHRVAYASPQSNTRFMRIPAPTRAEPNSSTHIPAPHRPGHRYSACPGPDPPLPGLPHQTAPRWLRAFSETDDSKSLIGLVRTKIDSRPRPPHCAKRHNLAYLCTTASPQPLAPSPGGQRPPSATVLQGSHDS
jgi:hypothetical protein